MFALTIFVLFMGRLEKPTKFKPVYHRIWDKEGNPI